MYISRLSKILKTKFNILLSNQIIIKKILIITIAVLFRIIGLSQSNEGIDSLKKYSYLIIGAKYEPRYIGEPANVFNLKPVGYGTGFFFRQGDSLLLISAAHIIYNIDVYRKVRIETDIDYLVVRYYDSLNQLRFHALNARDLQKTCLPFYFLDYPDIAWVYNSEAFKDGKLNLINNFLLTSYSPKVKKKYKRKFIAFGYPDYEQAKYHNSAQYDDYVTPSLYEGEIADSSHYYPLYKSQNIDAMYYTLTPKGCKGVSGAPVFMQLYKSKRKQWIEFAGVQSGINYKYDCDYVVKRDELLKLLNINGKKNKKKHF